MSLGQKSLISKKKQRFLNCTPKVRQKKSNFWGVFIMKLTYKDKVQIYELRKQGYSLEQLSNNHKDIGNTVIGRESWWKIALQTREFGYNCN